MADLLKYASKDTCLPNKELGNIFMNSGTLIEISIRHSTYNVLRAITFVQRKYPAGFRMYENGNEKLKIQN